jgi:hypothetical protein
MKKVSLAATIALSLLGATTVANANGTVKSQPAATATATATTTTSTPATAAAAATTTTTSTAGASNPATAELIARPSNRVSNFELDIMVPVFQPSCGDRLLAVDIRGMRDVKRNTEGNFGAVYRQIVNGSFVLGGYVYGDYRRTRKGNNFGQLTLGADILSNMVDARFNGYLAQKKTKFISGSGTSQPTGNTIARFSQFEVAQSGFDGEIGVRIPMPGMNNIETRVFAGGYHFSHSGTKTMAGPRGRLEVRILDLVNPGSRLTLGVDVSNDKVRKTTVSGVIGLRIPLQFISGGRVPQGLQRRLGDYVYRDVNVNTAAITKQGPNAKDPTTGKDYFFTYVNTNSSTAATTASGTGTFENQATTWDPTKANQAGAFTVFTGNGTIAAPAASVTVLNQQAFYGPASDIIITDANDGSLLTVQKASTTQVVTIAGNSSGTALFIAGTANPVVRNIAGFTHAPTAAGTSAFFTGTYTANSQVNINNIISTGNTTIATPQISVTYTGTAVTDGRLSVSKTTFNGLTQGAAQGVSSSTTAGATTTIATDTIVFAGGTLGVSTGGVAIANNASKVTFTDNKSTYSNVNTAINITDSTTGATAGATNFTITSPTTSTNTGAAIFVDRTTALGAMANTTMTGTISGGTFTSSGAASKDISVSAGTGALVGNVVLTLKDNKHTDTSTAVGLRVDQQITAGNTSTATITMSNVGITSAAGGNSIQITPQAGIVTAGSVRLNMTKVTTSGGAAGIAFVAGVAPTVTANQIQLDFTGAGNSIGGTSSIVGGGLVSTGAGNLATVGMIGGTLAVLTPIAVAQGAGGAIFGTQIPNVIAIP